MSRGRLSIWAAPSPRSLFGPRLASPLPYPLAEPGCLLYEWGRYALWHGLDAIGLRPGDEVLAPAYHHGSEIAALHDRGLACRFYEATESLEPDPEELERSIGPRTRALYVIHYLGFGLDARRWRRWCDERGLLLIEDVAMAWLAERDGQPLGSWGDLSFFSLWKTHGMPDGGAVVCRGKPAPVVPPRGKIPRGLLARGFLRGLAQRSRLVTRAERLRAPAEWNAAEEFSIPAPFNGVSAISLRMLDRSPTAGLAAIRRRNHARLVRRLHPLVPKPFADTSDDSCPFGVPVVTGDREGLLDDLRRHDINAVKFWSVPHPSLPVAEFPAAAARRSSTVLLPIHQQLDQSDVDRIGDAVLEFATKGDVQMKPAEKAPDFELLDQDGQTVSLGSLAGSRVVLYFYPEAETPGCTAQACGIRDHQADIAARGAVAIGISPDGPEKLRSFADRHGLPFKLLSDPGGRVAREYGVWSRRRRPPFRGETLRSTFLIDGSGNIERIFDGVDPATHDRLVLDALD
jgi:peroxiredoxin/dTDP-4-amino-4,6-dideoxygalactose transaminase